MRKAFQILFIALLALSFCSKDKAGAPDASGDQTGHPQKQPQDPLNMVEEPLLRIQAVALRPETPTILDDVVAKPVLVDPGLENINFRYQWFENGKEVVGVFGANLEKIHYKKGSWLYCRVKAIFGNEESEWFKSETIRVLNSLPVLRLAELESFAIPGEISYQAAASDADGDALTYEVLAPKEQGIVIDPKTGVLTWKIDAETVSRLGEKIEIKLAVSDGEGEKVTGTITLSLTSTKQTAPQ